MKRVINRQVNLTLPPAHPRQHELITILDRRPELKFVVGACGSKFGKLLNLKELVPTPTGWKEFGDLHVGDEVFAADGTPTKIVYETPVVTPEVSYKVTFSDDTETIVCSDHLWETKNHRTRQNIARVKNTKSRVKSTNAKAEVLTTQQIKDSLMAPCGSSRKLRPNHSVDNCLQVQYSTQDLSLDPYVLGVWLGDGSLNSGNITQHPIDAVSLIAEFKKVNFEMSMSAYDEQLYKVPGLKSELKKIGVLIRKHVPSQYLIGDVEQRLSLLQGLMDTDGTIDDRGHCTFDNTNENLADAVYELACSLGIKCNRSTRVGKLYGVDKKLCYRVWFTTELPVFRLKRKLDRIRPVSQKAKQRLIVSIERVKSVPMKCIQVDHPRHLYLITKSFIPTHNTFGCTAAIVKRAWSFENTINWWVAPTYDQCNIAFNAIQDMLPEGLYKPYKADFKIEILNPNGKIRSIIDFRSAEKESSLRGHAVNFFILDEAARVSRESWLSVKTTTTQTKGKGIIISTPMGRNWFYDVYQWGEKNWPDGTPKYNEFNPDPYPEFYSIRMPTWENPTVDPAEIELNRKMMAHDDFMQEIGAEFLLESAGVFRNIDLCKRGTLLPPVPGHRYQLGVDLARKKDSTVLTVIDLFTRHVVFFDRFSKVEWVTQRHRIEQVAKFYNNAKVIVDSTGVGDPIAEALTKAGLDVEPYTISSNTKKKHLIDNLRLLIEQGKISFPDIKELIDELRVFEYTFSNSSSAIKFSAPSGKHDDCVMSLALACLNMEVKPKQYTLANVRGI